MLNWDDEIKLSRLEVEHARRLAVAPLDEAIADTEGLLAELLQLNASCERDHLIERILALRLERLAIKRARLAQLDRMLPRNERVVPVRAADLKAAFNRYDYGDHKVICRNGSVVSFEPSKVSNILLRPLERVVVHRRARGCRVGRPCGYLPSRAQGLRSVRTRGLAFVASMLHRTAAAQLISRCGQQTRQPRSRPFCSRSVACRSRLLAPLGAPPWIAEPE